MYRSVSPDEYRTHHGLGADYKVTGFFCHGTWRREEEIANLKETLDEMKIEYQINNLKGFLRRMVEVVINGNRYWFDVPYGGAMLSEYLQLACLFGSQKNILIGSCGGLAPEISACDCIIPTYSFGNESSTRMYSDDQNENKHFADKHLSESLRNRLASENNIYTGPTTTCQAMLAETIDDVKKWSYEGYLAVEMEASTVFAVSNCYKVPSAAVLVVGDNLIKEETMLHDNFEKLSELRHKKRKTYLKAVIDEITK